MYCFDVAFGNAKGVTVVLTEVLDQLRNNFKRLEAQKKRPSPGRVGW
jgi:hypothetical protein